MQKHELKVLHVATERELIISKKRYLLNPSQYEVLEGDAPEVEVVGFEPPAPPPAPKLSENVKVTGDKAKPKAAAKKPTTPKKTTAKK